MLLAINVNNTNSKFSIYDGDSAIGEWRQRTSTGRTGDEHAVWLFQLMQMEGIDPKSIGPDDALRAFDHDTRQHCRRVVQGLQA